MHFDLLTAIGSPLRRPPNHPPTTAASFAANSVFFFNAGVILELLCSPRRRNSRIACEGKAPEDDFSCIDNGRSSSLRWSLTLSFPLFLLPSLLPPTSSLSRSPVKNRRTPSVSMEDLDPKAAAAAAVAPRLESNDGTVTAPPTPGLAGGLGLPAPGAAGAGAAAAGGAPSAALVNDEAFRGSPRGKSLRSSSSNGGGGSSEEDGCPSPPSGRAAGAAAAKRRLECSDGDGGGAGNGAASRSD